MTYGYVGECVPGTNLHFQRNTSALPMDKLQSFWPFREMGDGTSAIDLLGNSPLVAQNTMKWEPSNPCGGALGSTDFAGTNNYWHTTGDATELSALNRQKKFWISVWFYPRSGAHGVISARSTGSNLGWYIFAATADGNPERVGWGTASDATTWSANIDTAAWSADAWNHVVCGTDQTTGSGTAFISLNGATAVTGTRTINAPTSAADITFGNWNNSTNPLDGMIADCAYFVDVSANPTAAQIADLYNGGKGNTLVSG